MTIKELIDELKKCAEKYGPDITVCANDNQEIWFWTKEPAYWNGCLHKVHIDESVKNFRNVKRVEITSEGEKLVLHSFSTDSAILDEADFPVVFNISNEDKKKEWEERIEEWRKETRRIDKEIEIEEKESRIKVEK